MKAPNVRAGVGPAPRTLGSSDDGSGLTFQSNDRRVPLSEIARNAHPEVPPPLYYVVTNKKRIADFSKGLRRTGRRRYPFRAMEVGDSFLAPPEAGESAVRAADQFGQRHGCSFDHRVVNCGTRIWRTA